MNDSFSPTYFIDATLLHHSRGSEPAKVRAFFSNVYQSRQIDPKGVWKVQVYKPNANDDESRCVCHFALTDSQRRELIKALNGVAKEWTQADEDAYIDRKYGRDWHLAIRPEDV